MQVWQLPDDLARAMKTPNEVIDTVGSIFFQCQLVLSNSSRMLYVILALHWSNFFARMGLGWMQRRVSRW
jgi:hypothetical protein